MVDSEKKSKWGFGIFALYGAFVIFMVTLVIFVSMQEVQFTEADYYERGLAYQEQIDRVARTEALIEKIEIEYNIHDNYIMLSYNDSSTTDSIEGEIRLFRPSDSRLDFSKKLVLENDGTQHLATEQMVTGKWRIQIDWKLDSIEYFSEETIYIQ